MDLSSVKGAINRRDPLPPAFTLMHEKKIAACATIVVIALLVAGILGVVGATTIPTSAGCVFLTSSVAASVYLVNRYLCSIGTPHHLKKYDPIC